MNDHKLPCVNTLLLNRYMKEQDFEAARDQAIVAAQEAALAKDGTEDDVSEFVCSLEMGSESAYQIRDAWAELYRCAQRTQGKQSHRDMLTALGQFVYDRMQDNIAHRAEQKFWDEQ